MTELKIDRPAPVAVRIAMAVVFVAVGAAWYFKYFNQ
jgi:hypothetical protein